jgi:hypothetical protein
MDPATLIIAATAAQAVGSIMQANSQSAALQSQAQASSYNAAVSRQQSEQALQVSSAQQLQLRREQRQQAGVRRAAAAQAGVGSGGSTADILEQSRTLEELDVLNLAYEGSLKARGYSTQAELDDFYASSFRQQAKSAKRVGLFNAAGSIAMGSFQMNRFPNASSTVSRPSFNIYSGGRTAFT